MWALVLDRLDWRAAITPLSPFRFLPPWIGWLDLKQRASCCRRYGAVTV